jgi:hypothetical protein
MADGQHLAWVDTQVVIRPKWAGNLPIYTVMQMTRDSNQQNGAPRFACFR